MFLIVNGERRETTATRVDALLGELDYQGSHLAVAVNYDVVPRARWAETTPKMSAALRRRRACPRSISRSIAPLRSRWCAR